MSSARKKILALQLWLALLLTAALTCMAQAASVSIAWDPPIPSNNVAGYKIYYGLESRTYSGAVDAGSATQGAVPSLDPAKTYYFAITAYNASTNESDYSAELVWDNTAPTVTGPAKVTLEIDEGREAALPDLTTQVTVTDNFSTAADIRLVQVPATGTLISAALPVTITAIDEAGNTNFFVCAVELDVVPKPGSPVGVSGGGSDGSKLLINKEAK